MPEFLHRIRRGLRRFFRRFEEERSDEPPYSSTWTLRIRVEEDELDGGWIAECVDLPGCVSQGDTRDEALENLADALSGVMSVRIDQIELEARRTSTDDDDTEEHEFKIAIGA